MIVPLNWRGKLFTLLFTGFFLILLYGVWFVATQTITDEAGNEISSWLLVLLACLAAIVAGGCGNIALRMLPRLSRKRGYMTLTDRGIEDTLVVFNLFAFWTVLRVRLIPWEAVRSVEDAEGVLSLQLDVRRLPPGSTGWLATLLLRLGFPMSYAKITKAELEQFMWSAACWSQVSAEA